MAGRFSTWSSTLRQRLSSLSPSSSRMISKISYTTLPLDTPIEEETLPFYKPEHYYPVKIGDIYETRYQVTGKLGYGAYSTSWLCRDLHVEGIYIAAINSTASGRELKIYEHLARVNSTHPGQALIRELYDSFDLHGPAGQHRCLTMGLNSRPFNLPLVKMTVKRLLLALDFFHTEANVIHTDIKTDNLMLSSEDDGMLADFAKAEAEDPSPRKQIDESRIIYQSRRFRRPSACKSYGLPILCDFGEARIGIQQESRPFIQPHIYRAPEIIFELPWGSAADIWNLAGLIWDLFEGEYLFDDIFDAKGGHDPFKHLARMVALIGPPPVGFIRRSETTEQCFDPDGAWVAHEETVVPMISLGSLEKRLAGEEKVEFIQFMMSMLKWLPEERKTAKQLLEDSWLL
ncbi:kinase domain protein [Aspergillus uvarum CBS 121591]|uniref:non-specific serine/threonine protein kinase n=1 Tax=Aspergillus uvarum CBS 121591 TaxID=1448315 RepID=A0A319D4Z3_9EURO|nr:kinase domain protein [Aspergillus uvarum CBS 121591]PYH86143.1 kinase domain protein [Aspergillus uvarum CBS 121591]